MLSNQNYLNDKMKEYMKLIPADKYNHPGVYNITIGNEVVYVGKARNMVLRIYQEKYYCL